MGNAFERVLLIEMVGRIMTRLLAMKGLMKGFRFGANAWLGKVQSKVITEYAYVEFHPRDVVKPHGVGNFGRGATKFSG
jgi:hypothetical protein